MGALFADLGMSLDGYIAGPNAGPANPLGDGGQRIHKWMYPLAAFRERLGMSGGERNDDSEVVAETAERAGAYVMGRRMFDEGEVGWRDPPPFRAPVFVLTSHAREPWERQGGTAFTFVTEGIESAVEQARTAAAGRDVQVSGGAGTVQQALGAGLLDELQVHLAPILLGAGTRLFAGPGPPASSELQVSEQTYYRWRNQFGGMNADDAKRLKDLERQNATLKRLLADAELEKAALKEVSRGSF